MRLSRETPLTKCSVESNVVQFQARGIGMRAKLAECNQSALLASNCLSILSTRIRVKAAAYDRFSEEECKD